MNDEQFDELFDNFKLECDGAVFDDLKNDNEQFFYSQIFKRLWRDLKKESKIKTENNLINLLILISQDYPDDNENTEICVSKEMVDCFIYFFENNIDFSNITFYEMKVISLYIDIFFHAPHFVEFLLKKNKEVFLSNFIKILNIKYSRERDVDFKIAMENSVYILSYFDSEYIDKYKDVFLNHFDFDVRQEALEVLE